MQSVALRLIVDREREIASFVSTPAFRIEGTFFTEGSKRPVKATLDRKFDTEADARAFEATCRAQIAAPWTQWNCPPGTAVPKLRFQTEPPADLARLATVVETLARAGFRADPGELSERFGLHLTAADAAERKENA